MKIRYRVWLLLLMGAMCFLLVACSKSEAAKRVDELITNIGEVTLESELKIVAAENAASALGEADYKQLEQIPQLEAARAKYNELLDQELDGFDKIAYDTLIKHIYIFKNPESVRVISGSVDENSVYLDEFGYLVYLRITATNSFGGTISSYYQFRSEDDFYLDHTDSITSDSLIYENFASRDSLNIKKINKALEQYWEE